MAALGNRMISGDLPLIVWFGESELPLAAAPGGISPSPHSKYTAEPARFSELLGNPGRSGEHTRLPTSPTVGPEERFAIIFGIPGHPASGVASSPRGSGLALRGTTHQ